MLKLFVFIIFLLTGHTPDPCGEVKPAANAAGRFSKDSNFIKAIAAIRSDSLNRKEHSISFGRDTNMGIITSGMSTGDDHSTTVPAVVNRFSDLHNHLDNSPPFSGDVYGFIQVATTDHKYKTRYVITKNSTLYALIIIDPEAAKTFIKNYPPIPNPGYQPQFPDEIVDEFRALKYGRSLPEEMAIAFILDKYKSGIALLKQDSTSYFRRLFTKETVDGAGNKIYSANNCR